jgi:hypothetical protein
MAYLAIAVEKTAGAREREAWGWLSDRVAAFRADMLSTQANTAGADAADRSKPQVPL